MTWMQEYLEKANKRLPKKMEYNHKEGKKILMIDWDSPIQDWEFTDRESDEVLGIRLPKEKTKTEQERSKRAKQNRQRNKLEKEVIPYEQKRKLIADAIRLSYELKRARGLLLSDAEKKKRQAENLKRWRIKNKDKIKEKNKRMNDKRKDYIKQWKVENRDKVNEQRLRYYYKNRESITENQRNKYAKFGKFKQEKLI